MPSITSGNSLTIEADPEKEDYYIAVTGAGTASIVPWFGGMSVGNNAFSVSDTAKYNMGGVVQFVVTATGGNIEIEIQ